MSARYYMLVASLPPLPPLFSNVRTPISRLRLEERLNRMLEPDDLRELLEVERLMFWNCLPFERTDAEIVRQAERVVPAIRSPVLREAALWRTEMRSVLAALRRRAAGEPAPHLSEKWGYGRRVGNVVRNWSKPDFGLSALMPWVEEWKRLVEQKDALALDRSINRVVWDTFGRMADGHYFDFESVAIYVLRWDVIHRWVSYDSKKADERFERLVEEGLADYQDLLDTLN